MLLVLLDNQNLKCITIYFIMGGGSGINQLRFRYTTLFSFFFGGGYYIVLDKIKTDLIIYIRNDK